MRGRLNSEGRLGRRPEMIGSGLRKHGVKESGSVSRLAEGCRINNGNWGNSNDGVSENPIPRNGDWKHNVWRVAKE